MALDFPASPNAGDTYTSAGRVWQWDGTKWIPASSGGIAYSPIYVGDTPPVGPIPGALWWDSSVGQGELSIYYNDPNSSQWVPASNVAGSYLPIGGGTLQGDLALPAIAPVTPASAVPKNYVDANYSGFVNKLRNGTFDVWQRGTGPITVTNVSAYTADGWLCGVTGSPNFAAVANSRPGALSANMMQITGGAGATAVNVNQRIESYVAAALGNNAPITFQMWIYNGTGASFTPIFLVTQPTVTDNFASATPIVNVALQACPASAWTRVAYTFVVPSGIARGLAIAVQFGTALTVSPNIVNISEADLRATPNWPVGLCPNPPPPELRPVATELAFCQRYYQAVGINAAAYGWAGAASQAISVAHSAPVTMRAAPTVSGAWGQVINATGGVVSALADRRTVFVSANSVTAGGGYIVVYTINNLSAEL